MQSKNTIKVLSVLIASLILGEGVLGWGVYWPILLMLLDYRGIYWWSFSVGIIISVLRGIPVGLPSLFLLVVVGGLSMVTSIRTQMGWVVVIVAVLANFVFDKVFGLNWSLGELIAVVVTGLIVRRWFEKGETIRLNY